LAKVQKLDFLQNLVLLAMTFEPQILDGQSSSAIM